MDNFFSHYFHTREATTGPSATDEAPKDKGGDFGSMAVDVTSGKTALSVAAFKRAIILRANTMSQLLMQYQKLDKEGGNYVTDNRAQGGVLNYLLQIRPNPMMSAPVLFRQAMINVDLEGNAVIYIDRGSDGEVRAFWLCHRAQLSKVSYKYDISYNGISGETTLNNVKASDVIHLKGPLSSDCGLTGLSLFKYSSKAMTIAATNDQLVLDNASKGGRMKLLVQEDKQGTFGLGKANKKELEKIATKLEADVYKQDVILLNNIASVTPISQSLQQQEIQISRNFSVREIARITGVPPILLMDDSNSSYKSPEAATQEFLLRTIAPIIREYEAEFNSKLLGPEGYGAHRFHLCEKPLLRLDPAGSAAVAKLQLEAGVKTVNELRAEQDMPTVEGGDNVFISTNLQDVKSPKVGAKELEPENYTVKDNKEGGEV